MWAVDQIISALKEVKEKANIKGSFDAARFCTELGLNMNELVYLLAYLYVEAFREIREVDDKWREARSENERLNRILSEKCQGNGRAIQMAKVISGLPIATKKKKSLMDLSFQISMGSTDKELMEYFEISKSTLWRWKKELEEEKKTSKRLYF